MSRDSDGGSMLWAEIEEQPDAIAEVVAHNRSSLAGLASRISNAAITHVVVAARGTSDNAARYAQYVWGIRNRLTVALAAPSMFGVYQSPPSLEGSLVVGISQSGQSPDLVEVLAEARHQGRPSLAITNDGSSPLAAAADHVLELGVGAERSVAATKTYTAELAAVALVSAGVAGEDPADAGLEGVPDAMRMMLAQADLIAGHADQRAGMEQAVVLGRGFNQATAFEWALKLQELAYVLAHPYSTADFLHGPIALVEPGLPVLAVAPAGPAHTGVHELLAELGGLGADLLVVSDQAPTRDLGSSIELPPGLPEWLTPLPAIVAGQIFGYHLAHAKGLDPDRPRRLDKVTRTT